MGPILNCLGRRGVGHVRGSRRTWRGWGPAVRGEPMIKVEGLTKSFGRQPVLRELSLEVATGSITVIIGRSGGGKSVFLKHLIGLLRPDAGRILIDGVDITGLRGGALDEIRRRYGVVFQ